MPSRAGLNAMKQAAGGNTSGVTGVFNPLSGLMPLGFDLPVSCRFLLEIDGFEIGIFREVKGLEVHLEMVKVAEGGLNDRMHQFPGRLTWPNITLRRGLTMTDELFDWMRTSTGEQFETARTAAKASGGSALARYTGAITALDSSGVRLRSWNLMNAIPVRWKGPGFGVDEKSPLEEELEIAHDGFTSETLPLQPPALGTMAGF